MEFPSFIYIGLTVPLLFEGKFSKPQALEFPLFSKLNLKQNILSIDVYTPLR